MAEPNSATNVVIKEGEETRKPPKFATFKRAIGVKLNSAVKGTNNKAGAITRGTSQCVSAAIQHIKEGVNKTKREKNDVVPCALAEDDVVNTPNVSSSNVDESKILQKESVIYSSVEKSDLVTLGPFIEFITADTTLFFIFTLAAATYPTYEYWVDIWNPNEVLVSPLVILTKVGMPWMMVAFTLGLALGPYVEDFRWILPIQNFTKGIALPPTSDRAHLNAFSEMDEPGELLEELRAQPPDTAVAKHTLFMTLLGQKRSQRIQFRHPIAISPKVKAWTTLRTAVSNSTHEPTRSSRLPWQRNISPTDDGFLMQHLLKHSSFRRTRVPPVAPEGTVFLAEETVDSAQLGSFDLSATAADSLEGFVVEPIFQLRGMDVFLTDDPEARASTHPWLIEQGLLSVPTFIVNVLTQWGNIFIYFEMPAWVHGFQHTEEESDPDDVKALKRFLNGDENYRNDRLKMIPSLVDGPMPIRMVAPPKREKVVNCDWMPIIWNQRDEEMDATTGNRLCAQLEATLDCMTSRAIRSMAGLVKRYLHILSIDVAVVIAKPDGVEEDEPSACLGLWRFNHIDVSECPQLPDRYKVEAHSQPEADVLRASQAIGALSAGDLEELTACA